MPRTDPTGPTDETPQPAPSVTLSGPLPLGPAPFDAAAYVTEARRRLPELAFWLDRVGDDWESVTCEIGQWLREVEWEPDWPVAFCALDLWDQALSHPTATEEVRTACQLGPWVARVWESRYGRTAASRASETFRPHVDGTVARARAREMLWTPDVPAANQDHDAKRDGDGEA